jgi:type I restriction enzyme S subunit
VLRTKNFDQGIVKKLSDDVFLPSSFMTSNSKHICEPYDYHLVMVGASIGSRGMLFPHQLPALRNQNMWCFRSKNKSNFSQLLVKLYLDNFIDSKMGLASGSAREFFRKGDFQSHRLCFATPSLTGYFSTSYSVILEKIQNNLVQIEVLSELRDTLLPKLISGELRIPDAEKFLEEAGL